MKRPARKGPRAHQRQQGFAIGYIMLTLMLTMMVTYVIANTSNINASKLWARQTADFIVSEGTKFRAAVLACGTAYPSGNNTATAQEVALTAYKKYPGTPVGGLAVDTVCPGDGKTIAKGRNGVFLREAPTGLGKWLYHNNSNGIYMTLSATNQAAKDALVIVRSQIPTEIWLLNSDTDLFFFVAFPP